MAERIAARLARKSIAVGSGKGGVGKSTTALNLAVFYRKLGLKVALFDLDPLSNISVILDIDERRFKRIQENYVKEGASFSSYVYGAFPGLDIAFPKPKLKRGDSGKIRELIFGTFASELDMRYDIILYDLPAGIGAEENLAFLPFTSNLLVVTNAEPTSHVLAGGYIKAALEISPDLNIFFWHNKFTIVRESGFNPYHVIENYNRFADEELRIAPSEAKKIKDIAYIPHDLALDLLNTSLSLEGSAQVKIRETLDMLQQKLLSDIPEHTGLDANTMNLIKHFICGRGIEKDIETFQTEIEEYCIRFAENTSAPEIGRILAKKKRNSFTPEVRSRLQEYLKAVMSHPRRSRVLKAIGAVERSLESIKETSGLFAMPKSPSHAERVHKEVLAVLKGLSIASAPPPDSFTRNLSGILLFYFALWKLLASQSVQQVIMSFIPKRKNAAGKQIRDRNRQIRYLIVKDAEYHKKYFSLIKKLFPLVLRQVEVLSSSFGLEPLLLRDAQGTLNRNAYLKLFTNFVHDSIHAGLGVFIGFKFNTASEAIKKGAKNLLAAIGIAEKEKIA